MLIYAADVDLYLIPFNKTLILECLKCRCEVTGREKVEMKFNLKF